LALFHVADERVAKLAPSSFSLLTTMTNQPKSQSNASGQVKEEHEEAAYAETSTNTIVQLKVEHNEAFAATLRKLSVDKTKNDHCNRLHRMIEWMKTEYPEEAKDCTVKLTQENKSDPFKHFHNMTDDFVYDKVRYQYIAAYLSSIKKKENGKFRSISDYRKYYDALQFGCRQSKASFQKDFRPGMQEKKWSIYLLPCISLYTKCT
jgi:hypothetical protein